MKCQFKISWLLSLIVMCCALAPQLSAQTFKTLHSFNASDGANPFAGLILSGNTLYGTTVSGGGSGSDLGTVFALNSDGTGFRTLHRFTDWQWPIYTNPDGAHPTGGVILSGNTLYGTAQNGGSSANGTIFSVRIDGTRFVTLHNFTTISSYPSYTNSDGANPVAPLTLSGDTLYGTTLYGGSSANGTLFAVRTDGTGFTVLHTFTAATTNSSGVYTNGDGASPYAGLVVSSNTLYGTTISGGLNGGGTIFSIHTDGTGFTTLHNFTNIDGVGPLAALTLSGDTLYGTASSGGNYGNGTIFSVHTDGIGFATLHIFTPIPYPDYTNNDGANPQSELIISDYSMFGSARLGGRSGYGTVFAINMDGTDFTTLHDFTAPHLGPPRTNSDGFFPSGKLVVSSNVLYGTARYGGSYSGDNNPDCDGTAFSISLPVSPPQLTLIGYSENLILSWQTNHAGFDYSSYILQSTTNLVSGVWTTNLPAPLIVNGQFTVTNPITGTQQFFRLSQ